MDKTTITVICCVCGKVLRTKDGMGITGISHSYCDSCKDKEIMKMKLALEERYAEKEERTFTN